MKRREFFQILFRSFLGIGDFLGSTVCRKIVEGWFKQLEYATIVVALFTLSYKISPQGSLLFTLLGIFSLLLFFIYSSHFWIRDVEDEWLKSINAVNNRNAKLFPDQKIFQYSEDSLVPGSALLLIVFILTALTCGSMFVALSFLISV